LRQVMRVAVAAVALVVASPERAEAQDLGHDWGGWFAYAGQGPLDLGGEDGPWRWWFDGHARFADDSDGFNQSIVRPGIGYELSPASTLWLGYGWIHNDPPTGGSFNENRIWQQYMWGQTYESKRTFLARSRLEQRFVEAGDDLGWRFRQFVRWTTPLPSSQQLSLRFWDEILLDLNDTDWGQDTGFDQNRLFAGFGWSTPSAPDFVLEFGYLNQYVNRSSAADAMNHTLSVTLLHTR